MTGPVEMDIYVKTLRPGATWPQPASEWRDSKAQSVSDNSAEPQVLRTFRKTDNSMFASIKSPKLFPFKNSPYSYFTGSCAYESPAKLSPPIANYFDQVNPAAKVQADPTKPLHEATVFQPAFNARVRYDSNDATNFTSSNIKVFARLETIAPSTCIDPWVGATAHEMTLKDYPATGWGAVPAQSNELPLAGRHDLRPGDAVRHLRDLSAGHRSEPGQALPDDLRQHCHGRSGHHGRSHDHEHDLERRLVPMNRLREDDGFTLPELLVTLSMAMILCLATFALVEVVMRRSAEIQARVDTTQRARTGMDLITRQLRSQVCAWRTDGNPTYNASRSIDSATPTSLTFFTYLGEEADAPVADLHQIKLEGTSIVEVVQKGKANPINTAQVSFPDPATTRPLLDNVTVPGSPNAPVLFRYYKFDSANPPQPIVEIAPGRALTATEVEQVAKITIDYTVAPPKLSKPTTSLKNDVYVRTADPNSKTPKPTCLI